MGLDVPLPASTRADQAVEGDWGLGHAKHLDFREAMTVATATHVYLLYIDLPEGKIAIEDVNPNSEVGKTGLRAYLGWKALAEVLELPAAQDILKKYAFCVVKPS